MGTRDDNHSDNAVRLMEDFLKNTNNPCYAGDIEIVDCRCTEINRLKYRGQVGSGGLKSCGKHQKGERLPGLVPEIPAMVLRNRP